MDICDFGTCAGHQSVEMAKLGHNVVGTDISKTAVEKAKEYSIQFNNINVTFIEDDVLDSKLKTEQFDLITDRGTFHSVYGFGTYKLYLNTIKRLLKPNGILLVKTMSIDEKRFDETDGSEYVGWSQMPYHFKPQELVEVFSRDMNFLENWKSVFQTKNLMHPANAEVAIFKKQG